MQFLGWTPEGLMILGTASDGEYRTEIPTEARKSHEPTNSRLRNARMLADRIRQMCEAVLACRRVAPDWKLVTIVPNNAYLLTVAVSRLKPWLRTHRNLMKLLKLCSPCL